MRAAPLAVAAFLAGCAASAAPPQAPGPSSLPPAAAKAPAPGVAIANAGFEAGMKPGDRCALSWDCTMHNNPESFRFSLAQSGAGAGARSLCIERVADEPWALVTQALQDSTMRGKRVRLSMQVRLEGVTGGAGPWLLAQSRPVAHASRLAKGTAGWQRLAVELLVPPDASVLEYGATLEGAGKACLDDVRLEVLAP